VTPVVIVGKNRRLELRVAEEARRDGADVRVLGFVRERVSTGCTPPTCSSTKPAACRRRRRWPPGCRSCSCARCPAKKERNLRYLASHGAALRTTHGDELVQVVDDVLHDERVARRLRRARARSRTRTPPNGLPRGSRRWLS